MSKESILKNYQYFDEDKRAYGSRSERIEFAYTKKVLDKYTDLEQKVIELGCGTGYYGSYLSNKCKTYHGIDLVPKHIQCFETKIKEQALSNVSAEVGDATNLTKIDAHSYDLVLVFGPLYHLPVEERRKVLLESKRICKRDGILFFAYINKAGAYLRACLDDQLKEQYPNKQTGDLVLRQGRDDLFSEVFFYTSPEELEQEASDCGLQVLDNVGVDFTLNPTDINHMNDEKYAAWVELMDFMFKSRSCTGVSNHAILVCQNV